MTTIEIKIAKNGSKRYYVRENGKLSQISRNKAVETNAGNLIESLGKHIGEVDNGNDAICILVVTVKDEFNSGDFYHSIFFDNADNAINAARQIAAHDNFICAYIMGDAEHFHNACLFTVNADKTEEFSEACVDWKRKNVEEPAAVDIETLNRQAELYDVSGKVFGAISEALTPPIDCDNDIADQYESAYQTLKAAHVQFGASRREFGKANRDRIGQLKQYRKDVVNDRLHKVSAQVKALFDTADAVEKVTAVVHYTVTDSDGEKTQWIKDKGFDTTPQAAEWVIAFARDAEPWLGSNRNVDFAEIIDRRNGRERYTTTDADISALRPVEPEAPFKPDSPFAIARGLDDVFQKTFHKVDAPYMDVMTQDGAKIATTFGAAYISVDWRAVDGYVFGNHFNDVLARYDTPAQVETVISRLKDAIDNSATVFHFPTVDELIDPPEVKTPVNEFTAKLAAFDAEITQAEADRDAAKIAYENADTVAQNAIAAKICATVNAVAPDGWKVSFDCESRTYPVTFQEVVVTKLDSLALAKALPPEKFFDQFIPLIKPNFNPNEQYRHELSRELNNLQSLRDQAGDDITLLKKIDEMIDNVQRELFALEFNDAQPPEPPPIEFDENGEIIPCF